MAQTPLYAPASFMVMKGLSPRRCSCRYSLSLMGHLSLIGRCRLGSKSERPSPIDLPLGRIDKPGGKLEIGLGDAAENIFAGDRGNCHAVANQRELLCARSKWNPGIINACRQNDVGDLTARGYVQRCRRCELRR